MSDRRRVKPERERKSSVRLQKIRVNKVKGQRWNGKSRGKERERESLNPKERRIKVKESGKVRQTRE